MDEAKKDQKEGQCERTNKREACITGPVTRSAQTCSRVVRIVRMEIAVPVRSLCSWSCCSVSSCSPSY